MPAFQITAIDYDGSSDETDDRILWVWSETEEWLHSSLSGSYHQDMTALVINLRPDEYDFIMPKDVQALHDRLREFAGIPRTCDMVRGTEYMHPEHGRVTFIASDPDDGAYLIFKYWDEEKDEQAYIGCEASDVRFLPDTENQRP